MTISSTAPGVLQAEESELSGQLRAAQAGVHAALCDNIDTARALIQLSDLVTSVNKYLAKRPLPQGAPPDGAPALAPCRAPLRS
jgi:cysteinyl-tRNA synthetase